MVSQCGASTVRWNGGPSLTRLGGCGGGSSKPSTSTTGLRPTAAISLRCELVLPPPQVQARGEYSPQGTSWSVKRLRPQPVR